MWTIGRSQRVENKNIDLSSAKLYMYIYIYIYTVDSHCLEFPVESNFYRSPELRCV